MDLNREGLDGLVPADDVIVLASVASAVEQDLVDDWLLNQKRQHPGTQAEVVLLPHGVPPQRVVRRLEGLLAADNDPLVMPVRVFWVPTDLPTRSKVLALLSGRRTYRPPRFLQRKTIGKGPARARIVTGEPARVSVLRERWRETTQCESLDGFAQFVIRRAVLALEVVEYRLLGPEYKSPRLVKPEILASSRFRAGLQQIPGATMEEAGKILDEMATGWSRLSVDLVPTMGKMIFSRGFDTINYDREQVETMRRMLERSPAVMLFSHRSNLDSFVLTAALQENSLPRAHVFGGINMAFGIMGPLMRRSGVIFIRRNTGDDPLYKFALREYVGYLVEKRFNLSWSIEGTRSRTGKMLPPKLGLLGYVADAYLDGRSDDILLQPVSISFDQLHETTECATYARGADKAPEGLRWLYRFIKAQGERDYGKIYVRFPEAVSIRRYVGEPTDPIAGDPAAKRFALQKMAFEVAWRILHATPVNATGLVSALLLNTGGVALTLDQLHHTLQDLLDYLERNAEPMTESALRLRTHDGVRAAVDAVSNGHPVTRIDCGAEPVWLIAPEHEHVAAFYRNTVLHAFLETSIVQLALVYAARTESDPLQAFWMQTARLRDLLKFDFYFADSTAFRDHITEEMSWHEDWMEDVAAGGNNLDKLLRAKRPLTAAAALRPFFEAYLIVADVLRNQPAHIHKRDLTKLALDLGRQYVAQGRVHSNESVSTLLFTTAHKVAADQHLLEPASDLYSRRAAFRAELRAILRDLDKIERIVVEQFMMRETERHLGVR